VHDDTLREWSALVSQRMKRNVVQEPLRYKAHDRYVGKMCCQGNEKAIGQFCCRRASNLAAFTEGGRVVRYEFEKQRLGEIKFNNTGLGVACRHDEGNPTRPQIKKLYEGRGLGLFGKPALQLIPSQAFAAS
jgi:hypothetical protein